jgi:hypothetical protein
MLDAIVRVIAQGDYGLRSVAASVGMEGAAAAAAGV